MRTSAKRVLSLVTTVLLVSGCSSTVAGRGSPANGAVPLSAPTTGSAPASTSSPKPTRLSAANGSDLGACRSADCEILIKGQVRIPLKPKFGCTSFIMVYFTPNRVAFNVDCEGTGYVTGYFLGTGALRLANGITVEVDKIDKTGAVLHFLPKTTTDEPKKNQVNGRFGAAFTGR